jgi:hypothetical protein
VTERRDRLATASLWESKPRMSEPLINPLTHAGGAADLTLTERGRQRSITAVPPPGTPDEPTDTTFGDYDLLDRIGSGGMGMIYHARRRGLQRGDSTTPASNAASGNYCNFFRNTTMSSPSL